MHGSTFNDNARPSRGEGREYHRVVIEYKEYCARHDRTHQLGDDDVIGVGLGHASLTCDGVPVFEENGQDPDALPTAADAERVARVEPHRDWRIHLVSLREERHYRREGESRWVLYKRGYGLS